MKVWVRINHVGWVHLWRSPEDFEAAEPSLHFFKASIDPRWAGVVLSEPEQAALARGELIEIEDPGYLDEA